MSLVGVHVNAQMNEVADKCYQQCLDLRREYSLPWVLQVGIVAGHLGVELAVAAAVAVAVEEAVVVAAAAAAAAAAVGSHLASETVGIVHWPMMKEHL